MSHFSFARLDDVDTFIRANCSAEILQSIKIYQFPATAEPLW